VSGLALNEQNKTIDKYCNHKPTIPFTHTALYISATAHLLSESILNIVEPLTSPPLQTKPHAFPAK